MNRNFWGPSTWRLIHSAAATYTPDKALSFKQFIYSLPGILPCDECRLHLAHNLARVCPLKDHHMRSSETLFLWTYNLHDIVNQQLKKKSPSFATVWTTYFGDKPCGLC